MSNLGRELRICPGQRPGIVFAAVSLVLGVAFAALTVALFTDSGSSTSGDRTMVLVITSTFLGLGLLLIALRKRKLKRALIYRIFEGGVVRDTSTGREELPFADLEALLVRGLSINNGSVMYTIALIARGGRKMELAGHSVDNVDPSLVALLEQRSGRKAQPLTPGR